MEEKIRFEEITDDVQKIEESYRNNYSEWGPPLSLDQYIEREFRLHDIHTRNGLEHLTFAIILDNSDKLVAACEVLIRTLYHGGGSYTKDQCLASVFVHPDYRKRGICNTLIENVVKFLEERDPENQISLWSDVGDYYARQGFNFPASFQGEPQWNRSLICRATPELTTNCEFLDADETVQQILPEHQRLLRRDVDSLFHDCQGEIDVVVVLPQRGLYEQLQFRAIYTAEKLGLPMPTKFSARTPDGHGWISWTYMFGSKKLLVLGIFGSANEMTLLLVAASVAAAEYDCQVELYESSIVQPQSDIDELVAATNTFKLPVQLAERNTSLPMSIGQEIWVYQGGYAWY